MKTLKRTLAGFLAVLMLMSTVNLTAFAEAVRPEEPELSQEAAPEQPAPAEEKTAEPETAEEPEAQADGEALPAGDETAEPPVYKVVFRLTVTAAAEGEEAPESAVTEFARELAAGAAVTEPTAEELAILALPEGSVLDGWYLDPGYSQPADFTALKAEKDLVLYARAAAAEEAPEEPAPEAAPIAEDYGIMPIAQSGNLELNTSVSPKKEFYEVGDTIEVTFEVKNHRKLLSMEQIYLTVSGLNGEMTKVSSSRTDIGYADFNWKIYNDNDGNWHGWCFEYGLFDYDASGVLSGLHKGETLYFTFSYTFTEADREKGNFTITTKAANGRGVSTDNVLSNINVQVKKKQLNVTITGDKEELTYDGNPYAVSNYTYVVTGTDGKALDNDLVTVTYNKGTPSVSGTDARTYQMGLQEGDFAVTLKNKTDEKKYEIGTVTVEDGQLIIAKRPITVTVKAADTVHVGDESPIKVELEAVEGLVDDHKAILEGATGNVNTSKAALNEDITGVTGKLTIKDGENDVTDNYTVTYTGTADVLPKNHTITYKLEEGSPAPSEKVLPEQQTVAWNEVVAVDTAYGTTVETDLDDYGNPKVRWTFAGWYVKGKEADGTVKTVTTGDKDITLTGSWTSKEIPETKYTGNVTVEYYYDGEQGEAPEGAPTELSGKFGETVKVELKNPVTVNGVNYMLQAGEYSIQVPKDNSGVIQVHYLTDANKDGTADKNQTVEITVTGKEVTKTYNGDTQTALEYTVTMSVDGSETKTWENGKEALAALKELGIELTVDETAKASGKNADTYDMNLTADTVKAIGESFNDVQVISEVGTLIIEKAELTVTAVNAAKTFGDPDPEFKYTVEGLKNGETEENVFGAGQISVARKGNDEAQGTYNDVLVPSSEVNPTNYTVKYVPGDFTINKKGFDSENPNGLTVEELKDVTYNGQSQAQKPVVKDGETELKEGTDYDLSYSENTKDVGTVTVTVSFKGNYSGTAKATYDITRATLTVTTGNASKTYDGKPLTKKDGATITGLVNGETATVLVLGTITGAGEVKNKAEIIWTAAQSSNYSIHKELGTLTVNPAPVTVTANNAEKVYGDPDPENFTATVDGLVNNESADLIKYELSRADAEKNNVGEYAITATGDKAQGNYEVTFVDGTLTIKPQSIDPENTADYRDVTVTNEWKSVTYTGTEQKWIPELSGKDKLNSDTDYTVEYSTENFTDVGEITVTIKGTGNYKDSVSYTYTIEPQKIENLDDPASPVKVGDLGNVTYNGGEQKQKPAVTDGETVLNEGTDYELSFSGDTTNVGEVTVTVTLTGNYSGKTTRTYKITPYTIRIGGVFERVYNGEKQTIDTPNYLTFSDWQMQDDLSSRGHELVASISGTDVGEYGMDELVWSVTATDGEGNTIDDVTKNYQVEAAAAGGESEIATVALLEDGTVEGPLLIITPRPVTLTSENLTKEYDGTPLTGDETTEVTDKTVIEDGEEEYGFVEGQGATYTFTGSRTLPGTGKGENTFTYALNEGTKAENYEIKQVYGDLTVTDRTTPFQITMQPNGGAATYDGGPHTAGGFTETEFTVNGVPFTVEGVTTSVTATDAGTYPVEVAGTPVVKDAGGNDVSKQFSVDYRAASLTIDPAPATVTVNPAAKVYGGADPALTAAVTGLVNNEPATLINYTLARAAGENVGAYAITATGAEVQGNYAVTYVPANLTIDPAQVFVLADDAEKTAGEDDPALTATVMGMVNNEPAGLINYNLIRTEGEDVGEYDIIAFGAEAQGNYTVTYVPATLTINPALAVINEDDTPLGNGPDGYTLTENNTVDISEDGTPLAGSPVENCCVLHLLLLLGALAVELFYTYDRKKRQQEEFQVRRNLT